MWAELDAAELVAPLNFTVILRRPQVQSGPVGSSGCCAEFGHIQRNGCTQNQLLNPCVQVRLPGHVVAWCDIISELETAEGFNKQTGMLLLFFPCSRL